MDIQGTLCNTTNYAINYSTVRHTLLNGYLTSYSGSLRDNLDSALEPQFVSRLDSYGK
jgi:hypothetical protein